MDQATIHTVNEALQQVHVAMVEADRRLAQVLEDAGRTFIEAGKTLRGGSNLRPAPFFLTEAAIRALLDPASPAPSARTADVPVVSTKLVDRPRRSEDPRLAKANDDASGKADQVTCQSCGKQWPKAKPGVIHKCQCGVIINYATQPEPEPAREAPLPEHADPDLDRPEPMPEQELQSAPPRHRGRARLPLPSEPVRKADVMHRQTKDRDARELEKPVDAVLPPQRPAKIALPKASAAAEQPRPSQPSEKRSAAAVPELSAYQRRQRLQDAIMYLRRQCILVSVVDRDALVRKYRVSGKRDAMLADDVIAIAIERGFDDGVQANG